MQAAPQIAGLPEELAGASNMFFLGHGVHYPMALEAALKMKEITYIQAEAYPAGELKHGPIALIETGTPVAVFDGPEALAKKAAANIAEITARGARLIRVGADAACDLCVPKANPLAGSFALAVVAQLLAYEVAVAKDTDVDQPRNLAKSVLVE